MLKRVSFVSAFIAALSGVLNRGCVGPSINTPPFPLPMSRKDRRAVGRVRTRGKPQPAGSKLARMAAEGRITLRA